VTWAVVMRLTLAGMACSAFANGVLQALAAGQGSLMALVRAVARPMLASIFILQGLETYRRPEMVSARAEPVVRPLAERFSFVPDKTEEAVRINGAVQVVAGTMLALGRWPRLAALALAATLVPTTAAGHRFWEAEDDQERRQQRIHFLKNLSMLGGLLLATVDTAGNPSLAWRGRHAAQTARREVKLAARTAKVSGQAGSKAGRAGAKASRAGAKASRARAKAGQAARRRVAR
jgi:putative oxidoreductase